jgi:hypothetical protein
MEVVRDLAPLLDDEFFLGKEDELNYSAGIIGSKPGFEPLRRILKYYDTEGFKVGFVNIPLILTKYLVGQEGVSVYPYAYFYPYNPHRPGGEAQLLYSDVTDETYAIHHWEKKWRLSLLERVFRKLAISKLNRESL